MLLLPSVRVFSRMASKQHNKIVLALARILINAHVHMGYAHDQSFTRIAERCTTAKQLFLNSLSHVDVICSVWCCNYVCWLSNACQLPLFASLCVWAVSFAGLYFAKLILISLSNAFIVRICYYWWNPWILLTVWTVSFVGLYFTSQPSIQC